MTAQDSVAQADRLMAQGRRDDAVAAIATAAAGGNAGALFRQAIWRLVGDPLPRDLKQARGALRAAATRGHAEARLIEIALVANGSGADADWREARRLLDQAMTSDANARYLHALLSAMALDEDGSPTSVPPAEDLVAGGSVRRVRRLLTPGECAHVARSAGDLLEPASIVDPRTGRSIPHPIRTSDAAVIGPVREDLVIRAINRRIAAISDTAIDQGEALTVLRYQPGQQFRLHSDALPGVGNQRVKTVLIYLNEGYEGGETVFPAHGLTIRPAGGDAIVFTNTADDGSADPTARHAGLPVIKGVKWLATRWIRARPFDVWTGPESAA